MYPYPKIIVSDAESSMEYPMITMDRGYSPNYTYLFAHEVGHNWFFGVVGSNVNFYDGVRTILLRRSKDLTSDKTVNVGRIAGDTHADLYAGTIEVWDTIDVNVSELSSQLEDIAEEIAVQAVKLANHAGRKTVKDRDIKLAAK